MALLAPPDVGIRGRALLRTVRFASVGSHNLDQYSAQCRRRQLPAYEFGRLVKSENLRHANFQDLHPDPQIDPASPSF
jgi:hypothetical protein